MDNWNKIKIGDLGRVVTGKTPPTSESKYFNGEYYFISPKDMKFDSRYILSTQTKITKAALNKFKNQVIPKNSVMFTALSFGFGKIGLAKEKCLTNQQINSIIVNEKKHDYNFVYYLLRYSKPYIFTYNSGIETPLVPKSTFESILVKAPPLPTQKKIANTLSAYDDLIENNNQRIQLLEEMAAEIYKEWFVRFRFPGYKSATFVDKEGKEVPHGTDGALPLGWEKVKLGAICVFQMGQSPKSEFYNDTKEGLPFHQGVTNFNNRFPTHSKYCTDLKRIADNGDILLSVRAPVGRINIANKKLVIGRGLCSITHKGNLQNYLFYLLKDIFKNEDSFGNGAVFNAVSRGDLERISTIQPLLPISEKYQTLVKPIDDEIQILIAKNETLQQTRDLLLPRLISGKLSVENLALPKEEASLVQN